MKKVNVYVFSRFHAFDLAKQLENRHFLNKLISTYPFFIAKKWQIPRSKFKSRFLIEVIIRISRKLKLFNGTSLTFILTTINSKLNIFHIK